LEVLNTFRVCALTEALLHSAMNLSIDDYEDAVQAFSALTEGLDVIVTRDLKDFAHSPIRAVSPAEFVEELA
jgi:hypothetical protein